MGSLYNAVKLLFQLAEPLRQDVITVERLRVHV